MSRGRLYLYRFVEDAWAGGLGAWSRGAGEVESWLLTENPGQTRWLMRKLAGEGIEGIRIFDADGLREELAGRAGIKAPPRHLAAAAFMVKAAAGRQESAQAAARNAGAVAEACDALARAGWHLSQLRVDEAVSRRINRTMEKAANIAGIFERRLGEALPAQAARLCCVGWDAARWPDLALLALASSKVQSCDVFAPMPRLPADALQREWIEELERRLELERGTCPESGFASANEPLVARLEGSELAGRAEARAPELLVGREWADQVRLVCGRVTEWLAVNPDALIGVIAPEDSPAAVAVAEALEKAGVRVEHPKRPRELEGVPLIIEQVARYHLGSQDIEELIELATLLWLHARREWGALEPQAVRDALDRAFQAAQSRNARILAQALPHRKDAVWIAVRDVVEALGRWDVESPWPVLREKFGASLTGLRLPAEVSAPWGDDLFSDERIPGNAFMEWLVEEAAARRREAASPDHAMAAQVVVTTFAGAAQQPWEKLIILDCNENAWPAPIIENPFLPDAVRERLNNRRGESGRLMTTRDLRALEQARFLDLLEHCRGPIAFAGVLLAQTEGGGHAQPNDWVLRALFETGGGELPADLWQAAAKAYPAETDTLADPERAHLERVHASRQDATKPFDRYMFNFGEAKLESGAWPATGLDLAVKCPATFALRELFGAEPVEGFARSEGAAVGNRAHRWLGRVLGLGDHLAQSSSATGDNARLARELAAARRELEEWHAAEGLPLPIWWETCLRKTAWAARRCLREVRGWLDGKYCAMEQKLAVRVRTPAGPLLLKGRIDILISDRAEIAGARVRMFDFKTGRGAAPALATLEQGNGGQFAAYYLMALDAGAAEAVIGIIKPEERALDVFAAEDEDVLRARFGVLAELQRTLRFGRRGPLVSDYGVCETLPLATAPIEPAILEQKAGLVLLAQ